MISAGVCTLVSTKLTRRIIVSSIYTIAYSLLQSTIQGRIVKVMSYVKNNLAYLISKHRINPTILASETGVPQPTIFRILAGETGDPRRATLEPIARRFRVTVEMLQTIDLQRADNGSNVGEVHPISQPFKQVPVVGNVKGGADGYLEELGYPEGFGDGHVEYPARDANTYALRVRGDSMRPRIKPGEFIVVEPNHSTNSGDDVVVICKDGRKLLKELLYIRDDTVTLASVNSEHSPISIMLSEITAMHYVAAIVPSGAFYKPA